MYKSKLFISFTEKNVLKKIISGIIHTDVYVNNNINYYKQLELYSLIKAHQFIKYYNNNNYIEVRECKLYTMSNLPTYIFTIIYTKTNTNHPYLLFYNLNDTTITFILPYGGEYNQIDKITYYNAILEANMVEATAILILLEKTIFIRKYAIIESNQFSLINCNNISNCVKKMNEIDTMNLSLESKDKLKIQYNDFYLHKALDFLKYYFTLLENNNLYDAQLFLKVDKNKHNNNQKYYKYKKQRLDTFFNNTKQIIGHLEIFISLYELFHTTKNKLQNI